MLAFPQAGNLLLASLQNACSRHSEVRKAPFAFRNGFLSRSVQIRYESTTEALHFRKRVRFAALIGDYNRGTLFLILSVSGSKSQFGSGVPGSCLLE